MNQQKGTQTNTKKRGEHDEKKDNNRKYRESVNDCMLKTKTCKEYYTTIQ